MRLTASEVPFPPPGRTPKDPPPPRSGWPLEDTPRRADPVADLRPPRSMDARKREEREAHERELGNALTALTSCKESVRRLEADLEAKRAALPGPAALKLGDLPADATEADVWNRRQVFRSYGEALYAADMAEIGLRDARADAKAAKARLRAVRGQ